MAISRYDIFISHKHTEWPFARSLFTSLTAKGYSCWYDADGLHSGNLEQIFQYIDNAKDIIVIINKGNFKNAKTSQWQEDFFCREVEYALRAKKNIIPIILTDAKYLPSTKELMPPFKAIWQYKYLTCLSSDSYDGLVHYTLIKKGFLNSAPQQSEYIQLNQKEIVIPKYKLYAYRFLSFLLISLLSIGVFLIKGKEKPQNNYIETSKNKDQMIQQIQQVLQKQDSINAIIKEQQHSQDLQESRHRTAEKDK